MLTIEHLSKTYSGGKRAVEDLSFEVPAGKIVGFIGHNGAGKTTTLRCVAGILDFDEGTITIDGHDIRTQPVAAKQVTAFLPDNPDLYEFMTGVKYLKFIADIYGIPAAERTERIRKYADAFELTGALGSPIGGYSHGMKQKLALISDVYKRQKRDCGGDHGPQCRLAGRLQRAGQRPGLRGRGRHLSARDAL